MKKLFVIALIVFAVTSCKKEEWAPEGPTDVRVYNLTADLTFNNVIIKTAGGRDTTGNIKNLGTISPGDTSIYQRVTFAYPQAEITAMINGQLYTTGTFQSTYLTYISRHKITYKVLPDAGNKLKIHDVVFEEPLVLK